MDDRKPVEDLYSITRPWFVSRITLSPDNLKLDAYLDHEENCRWQCPVCSKEYCISDHVKERIWRDLDSGIYQVYIHARIPRVNCIEHGKLQVTVPWSAKHSRFSMRFESLALGIMRNMDIMNSSMILGITWNMAQGIMGRAVERGLARKSSVPERMGIDEKDNERLKMFGPEAKLELLTSLLSDMEKTGQLDQLRKVISAMGNNKNE